MGGIVDPVGVVSEPKPEKQVVVEHPAPPRRRRYTGFPWDSRIPQPIPWERRTYTFDWTCGSICVLPEEWFHKRDEENQVVGSKSNPIMAGNHLGYPEFDLTMAKRIREYAAHHDAPIAIAFCKVYPTDKLTREDMESIAQCPDVYAKPLPDEVEASDRKKKAADFFKKLEKAK